MDVERGLHVYSGSGDAIGTVKRVAEDRFLVNRRLQRDLWLTLDSVARVEGEKVVLKPQTYEVDDWTAAPL